jgi:hypothetical protein
MSANRAICEARPSKPERGKRANERRRTSTCQLVARSAQLPLACPGPAWTATRRSNASPNAYGPAFSAYTVPLPLPT